MHVKYEFIRDQKAKFSVNMLCKMMKVGHSGYFAWVSRKPSKRTNENIILGKKMRRIFEKSRGNCYDNAITETFFSTLKKELVYQCKYLNRTEAKNSIFEYIEVFYNRMHMHSSLDYISPFEYEARVA